MNDNNNGNDEHDSTIRCSKCQRKIEFGEKAFAVEEGFIGPRGFVALESVMLFCSEKCVRDFFQNGNGSDEMMKQARRIP